MIRSFINTVIGIAFVSCSRETITMYKDVNALPVSLIYKGDTVYKFVNGMAQVNADVAKSYLKKGEDAEAIHPEKAIYHYKRAITLNPSREAYLKLAKILEKSGLKSELAQLYEFMIMPISMKPKDGKVYSQYVFGAPDAELYYEYLVATILKNQSLWGEDVYVAKELGFDTEIIKKRLISDSRIGIDTSSMVFKNILLQFLNYEEFEQASKDPEMFRNFVSTAIDTVPTFSISEKQVGQFNYLTNTASNGNFMENDFSAIYRYYLIETKEQPNLWFRFNLTHHLHLSNKFTTLICAIDTSNPGSPPEMRNIYYRLVTYDTSLNVIDNKIIAVQSGEQLWTVEFRKNRFNIHHFKRTFRKPYNEGEYDNEVTGLVLEDESYYEINENGQIIKTNPVSVM
ncbi:MAG: tetratricopeptide repeat protein [Bacteroidia bacterium]|jgi:hypothetical protein|nr:tetratricopeptide repeat protein [Bacteroidia bacterium]